MVSAATIPSAEHGVIIDRALSPFVRLGADGFITGAGGSVVELLGRTPGDLCGRWMLELLHPHSHDAVLEAFHAASDNDRVGSPQWVSSGLIVDLIDIDGETVACDLAVATSNRTGLPGFVIQLRRAGVTVALRQTVKAMGADEPLDDVLRSVARVLEMSLAASLVEVAHGVTTDGFASSAGASPLLPEDDGGPGDRPWVESARSNQVCRLESLDGLPERVQRVAEAKGVHGLLVHPICQETLGRPVGTMLAWMRRPTPTVFYRDAMQDASQLAALALQWDEGRRSLRWAAGHDELTGIGNRRTFMEALRTMERTGDGGAVLYIDLDDFKPVNDRYGHAVGDEVLAVVADRFARCVRPDATIARIGGDEFAVLNPDCDDITEANEIGARLLESLDDPIVIEGAGGTVRIPVSASIGVALAGDVKGDHPLAAADANLLVAKAAGKAQVRGPVSTNGRLPRRSSGGRRTLQP